MCKGDFEQFYDLGRNQHKQTWNNISLNKINE
jgi:hypothetical protein